MEFVSKVVPCVKAISDEKVAINKFMLHLACLILEIDIIIINNSEPIHLYRPRQDAFSDPESALSKLYQEQNGVNKFPCFLGRHVPGRPLYFNENYSTNELEVNHSHFVLLLDFDKISSCSKLPLTTQLSILNELQTYPSSCILQSKDDEVPVDTVLYKRNGKEADDTRKRKGKVHGAWEYFIEVSMVKDSDVTCSNQCKLCDTAFSKKTSLTVLQKHLKKDHEIEFEADDQINCGLTQSTIKTIEKGCNGTIDKELALSLFKKVLEESVVDSTLGFGLVERKWFKNLVHTLLSLPPIGIKYTIPSRHSIKRHIAANFSLFEAALKDYFINLGCLSSFTLDGWTDTHLRAFYLLTIHWISKDWKMYSTVLDIIEVEGGDGVGKRVGKKVLQTLVDRGIDDNVYSLSSDNAPDALVSVKTVKEEIPTMEGIRCGGHIIQLGVKEVLPHIALHLSKLRNLITEIRASKLKRKAFRRLCRSFDLKNCSEVSVMDSDAKWASTFILLNDAIKKRRVYTSMCEEEAYIADLSQYELGKDEWKQIQIISSFLSKFVEYKNELEPSSRPCGMLVMRIFANAIQYCKSCIANPQSSTLLINAARAMQSKLEEYFVEDKLITTTAQLSQFFDPRFSVSSRKKHLIEIKSKLATSYGYKDEQVEVVEESVSEVQVNYNASLYEDFEEELSSHSISGAAVPFIHAADEYLALGQLKINCLLEFWKGKQDKWPELCDYARDILASQPTSCASERAASACKLVLQGRTFLHEDNLKMEMLMREWRKTGIELKKDGFVVELDSEEEEKEEEDDEEGLEIVESAKKNRKTDA